MVTILDGECEVWVAGNTFQMKTGETIIFPAGVPHALSAITKFKMSLVMIKEMIETKQITRVAQCPVKTGYDFTFSLFCPVRLLFSPARPLHG